MTASRQSHPRWRAELVGLVWHHGTVGDGREEQERRGFLPAWVGETGWGESGGTWREKNDSADRPAVAALPATHVLPGSNSGGGRIALSDSPSEDNRPHREHDQDPPAQARTSACSLSNPFATWLDGAAPEVAGDAAGFRPGPGTGPPPPERCHLG